MKRRPVTRRDPTRPPRKSARPESGQMALAFRPRPIVRRIVVAGYVA